MTLKERIINHLSINRRLYRTHLTELVKKWGYEKSNAERRLREICETYPVKRFDIDGKEVSQSKWICYWKLTGKIKLKTVFK